MEDKATNGLKEQRERRKRINRMKTGIIATIAVWILVSMILCITLLCKVISLQKQLDTITSNMTMTNQVAANINQAEGDSLVSSEIDVPTEPANASDTGLVVNSAGNNEDNLAQPGDPLKVYLTFDDGPSSNTQAILDTLAQYNVKATFFVVGKEDDASKALYKEIVDAGHTLGMHSFSHKYSVIYDSLDNFEADFTHIQNYLYDVTGEDCLYYRFPGGSSNQVSNTDMGEFIKYLNDQGVTYFDWNVSSGDATSQAYTTDELVENVMNDVVKYKTSIVLRHDSDTKTTTVEALGPMIEALQAQGVELLPISEDTTVIQHISADSVQ